jgi:predicted ATPase
MIKAVRMTNFRGVRMGTLDDFAPLTVLVGPNGCGKSTVLDALLIGSSPRPLSALKDTIERRSEVVNGVRWLFYRGDYDLRTQVALVAAPGHGRAWELFRQGDSTRATLNMSL